MRQVLCPHTISKPIYHIYLDKAFMDFRENKQLLFTCVQSYTLSYESWVKGVKFSMHTKLKPFP